MPEFVLNDSHNPAFTSLPELVQGYIEAMFFTEECSGVTIAEFMTPEFQERMREGTADGCIPGEAGFNNLHESALERIKADCGAFHVKARDLLMQAYARDYDARQAGRDFWYTRNGHGVGFWDRKELADGLGDALSAVARDFGETHVWFANHVTNGDAPFIYHE